MMILAAMLFYNFASNLLAEIRPYFEPGMSGVAWPTIMRYMSYMYNFYRWKFQFQG